MPSRPSGRRRRASSSPTYLPKQLSDEELQQIVAQAVEEAQAAGAEGPRAMGQVMKIVNPKVAGQAEGGRVAAVVKQLLAGG